MEIVSISFLVCCLIIGVSYAYSSFTYYGTKTDKVLSIAITLISIVSLLNLLLGG